MDRPIKVQQIQSYNGGYIEPEKTSKNNPIIFDLTDVLTIEDINEQQRYSLIMLHTGKVIKTYAKFEDLEKLIFNYND